MTNADSTADKNWRILVEAYELRQQNEADRVSSFKQVVGGNAHRIAPQMLYKAKFPNRLRVTSIAE
ncbi:MAG: hypothetical protein P8L68_04460 [Paracoccaceae bacterium]|nr:hypothetical protein [Paracoccaceae bacterium]MDG2257729.1 hypothetical protein [Paracoccaceae bacterium]